MEISLFLGKYWWSEVEITKIKMTKMTVTMTVSQNY